MCAAVTVCLLFIVLSTSCLIPSSFGRAIVSRRFCDANQFLDVQRDTCRNCSTTCSTPNHIIRRTCSAFADSVCGPFFEFRPPPQKQQQQQQDEDAAGEKRKKKDGVMQRQKNLLRRQKGAVVWSLLANDTAEDGDEEYSGGLPHVFLLPPPPPPPPQLLPPSGPEATPDSEPADVEQWCCWTSAAVLGILISASLLCVVIVAMVTWIIRRRIIRDRKSLSGPISGARVGRLRRFYPVTTHVASTSLFTPVDKRVMHLELQLHRNWHRRAGGATDGGTSSGSSQSIGGNDYVKDELRRALVWNRDTTAV